MPLPERNQTWPPPAVEAAGKLYTRWGAWYSGDPEQLVDAYSQVPGIDGTSTPPSGQPIGPRFLSGIARGVQRMFWGTPTSPGQVRGHKLHVPLAGDIAMTSADLLFGEPVEFVMPDAKKDDPTQIALDDMLDESNLAAVLLEGAEIGAAYGGYYLRVRWDSVLADCPLFDALPPDAAVPEWRGGRLVAVTLWRNLERIDGRWWRHLERHEKGRVLHGVYVSGDENKLGRQMALTDHPETAQFAMIVDAGGDGQTVTTGATGLSCEYIPNMRPHRTLRGSPLGRSDYAGIEAILDALDEAWTSWMRDLRIGKGRLVVPRSYMSSHGRGRGASFDADREVYEAVDTLAGESSTGGLAMQVVQFKIRVDEHSRTCRELTVKAVSSAGYSPQTFGESDQIAATATEVVARNAASFRTRSRKVNYHRGPVRRVVFAGLEIYREKFPRAAGITPAPPMMKWPDGVAQDQEALARTLQMIQAAEAASIRTRVKLFNPDWDDTEVDKEVSRIHAETGVGAQAPPGGGGGGSGFPGGPGKEPE